MSQKITLYQLVAQNLDHLFQGNYPSSMAIACSGGSDSMALVKLILNWVERKNHLCSLHVLTVDHQLRPESTSEAHQVGKSLSCDKLSHHILTWQHDALVSKIQEQARQARYDLMLDFCLNNQVTWLMTGHHFNDQLETITMRLCAKSQLRGLAGISAHKLIDTIHIGRPLLNISKGQLQHYLIQQKVSWVEDPTNIKLNYLRNRIRHSNHHLSTSWVRALQQYRITEEEWLLRFYKKYCHSSSLGYWRFDWQACKSLPLNFLSIIIGDIATKLTQRAYPPRHHSIIKLCLKLQEKNFKSATLGDYIYTLKQEILIIRKNSRTLKERPQSYNGSHVDFAGWNLKYLTSVPNLIVGHVGIKGWQQLIAYDPTLKKLPLHKSIVMGLPWLWQQHQLFDIKFLVNHIIMRETQGQDVLRLNMSYHQSPFCLLKIVDDNVQENLNVRIAQ